MTPPGPAAILVGPLGAGVPEVARELGALLGLPVRDTDADVEAAAGLPVAELFVTRGEAEFRELERAAVVAALAAPGGVLALGAGAPADPRTEAALQGRPVAFLDVGVAVAARRLGLDQRPIGLPVSPRAEWLRQAELRRTVYRRVATVEVATDELTAAEAARQVARQLGLLAEETGEPL